MLQNENNRNRQLPTPATTIGSPTPDKDDVVETQSFEVTTAPIFSGASDSKPEESHEEYTFESETPLMETTIPEEIEQEDSKPRLWTKTAMSPKNAEQEEERSKPEPHTPPKELYKPHTPLEKQPEPRSPPKKLYESYTPSRKTQVERDNQVEYGTIPGEWPSSPNIPHYLYTTRTTFKTY